MSFLSVLGTIITTGERLFLGFAPTITQNIPGTANTVQVISKDFAAVGDAVTSIEAIGQLQGLSGPDKAKAVGPLVAQIILNGSLVAGRPIQDQAKFQAACVTIGGAVADVLDSLHPDSTSSVTAAVPTKK